MGPTCDAARHVENHFRIAMHHSAIGMAMVAPTGHWMEVNPALCAIVGYSREELLATTFQRLTHPEDLDADLDLVRRTLAREIETYQMEKRYFHKDGRIVWIQLNATMVWNQDGAPRYCVSQIQDISARKAAEAQLRAMNDRYARQEGALAALARLDIVKLDDLPALLREVTEVVSRTLGVERVSLWKLDDALARLTCSDLYTSSNDRHSGGFELETGDYPAYFEAISGLDVVAAHRAETDPRTREFWPHYLRPLGISSMMDTPVHLRGEPVGVLCCEHVGPPRIWTPDEQTFSVAVASMLAALHAQVERQKVEAQLRQSQKLEAIGQLAGGVAHDFNNLLTVILGKASLLEQEPALPESARAAVRDIAQSGGRAAQLTRQLLAFSRRQAMQMRDADLNATVAALTGMLPRMLGEQVTIECVYESRPACVHADTNMIDQVLLNLAVNARDAMPSGGTLRIATSIVTLDAEAAKRTASARQGEFVCLTVADNGAGIEPEHLPRIFEPFFTTKDVGRGTGLGLATTYGIVQQHNGWIQVASEVGKGTSFEIYLPRCPRQPSADPLVPAPAPPAPAPKGRETVLLVEDESALRSLVREALTRHGYRVIDAASGPKAVEAWLACGKQVDLLLTDVVMPDGMTGFDVADRLREDVPRLPVIYASGYHEDFAQHDRTGASGASFLLKPYSLHQLAQAVRDSLDLDQVAGGL